jgi:tetratricopeptide (TPR) repeat protein
LRATIEWSYHLLGPEEQQLFARLSVFQGGCTLEAAEVCGADLDGVQSLVDKSLLRFTEERFWMLETIREYAAERLEEAGEADLVRSRHARFMCSSLAEPRLLDRATWTLKLEAERENLRAALGWALDNETSDTRLALASQYGWVCMFRGPLDDGRSFLVAAVGAGPPQDSAAYARALWGLGAIEWRLGDLDSSRSLHERCLSIARKVGDDTLAGRALRALGIIAAEEHDVAASESLLGEALAVFRELDDRAEVGECLHMLGWGAMVRGDYSVARELIDEALTDAREAADTRGVMRCAANLAFIASEEKRFADARELAQEGLVAAHELSDVGMVGEYLAELARVAAELGDPVRSAVWLGGADAAYEATESTLDSRESGRRERTVAILVRELGTDRMEHLLATGGAMTVDALVTDALAGHEAAAEDAGVQGKRRR